MEWLLSAGRGAYVWTVAHKDGLLVMATVAAPLVGMAGVLVAATISARAARRGPLVQREIAAEQLRISREQFALQRAIAIATQMNAVDQKWAETFQSTVADALNAADLRNTFMMYEKRGTEVPPNMRQQIFAVQSDFQKHIHQVELLLPEGISSEHLTIKLRQIFLSEADGAEYAELRRGALTIARAIRDARVARSREFLMPSDDHAHRA